MLNISSTLLAAAHQWGSRPVVSLEVRDERPRWKQLLTGGSSGQVSQIVVALSTLLRARVTSAGLSVARVNQPALGGSAWTSWTLQHTLPLPASDVAVTVVGNYSSSTNCRIFFLSANGSAADLRVTESANGFLSPVSTAGTVAGSLSQAGWLAAANECAFYGASGSALRVWRKTWAGGSWSEGSAWPAGTMGTCYGIGACWDPINSRAVVLAARDGAIYAALYNPASDSWSQVEQLAPGGEAGAGAAASYRLPSVCFAGDRVVAAWVEALQVTTLRTVPVSCEARVYPHFGSETALDLRGGSTLGRPNLAYHWTEYQVFAADEGSACVRSRYGGNPGAALRLTGLEPAAYRLRSDGSGSRLTVRLPNLEGRYNTLGSAGSPCEALKPHSTLILRRGYRTSAGDEVLSLPPHYITSARLLEGSRGGWLELEAADGRALLGCWRAGETLSWQNRTLRWLLEELCARAGIGYADNGSAILANAPARYTLALGASALEGITDLLRLAGCTALMRSAGLYALPAAEWAAAAPAEFGTNGEIRRASYGCGAPDATARVLYGTLAEGYAEDAGSAMALGMRSLRARADERLTSAAWACAAARAELLQDKLAARCELLTVPLRPELELWDPALVYGAEALPDAAARRITALAEHWDAEAGLFETEVELGAG